MIWGTTRTDPKTLQHIPVVKLILSGSQIRYEATKFQNSDEDTVIHTANTAAAAAQAAAEAKLVELGFKRIED